MSDGAVGSAHCPRCGGGFHCGINDTGPCPCTRVSLSPELQASLRQRFTGCLCLRCLQDLAQQALLDEARPPAPRPAGPARPSQTRSC